MRDLWSRRFGQTSGGEQSWRTLGLTGLAALVHRLTTTLTALVVVPLTVGYLGPERYGLWMTLSAGVTWLSLSDLGVGAGLLNSLTTAVARKDFGHARLLVSNTFAFVATVGCSVVAITWLSSLWVPWTSILRVRDPLAQREVVPAILILGHLLAFRLFLSPISRIFDAIQRRYLYNLALAAAAALSLLLVLGATRTRGGLPALLLALSFGEIIVALCTGVLLFARFAPELRPRSLQLSLRLLRGLIAAGVTLLSLDFLGLVTLQSAIFWLSWKWGPSEVTSYSITLRVYQVLLSVAGLFIAPMWPIARAALARGDARWARSAHDRLSKVLLAAAVALALVAPIVPAIVRWWARDAPPPSSLLAWALAVQSITVLWATAQQQFLLATGSFRLLGALWLANAALSLLAMWLLAGPAGPPGVAIAPAIGSILTLGIIGTAAVRRRLRESSAR